MFDLVPGPESLADLVFAVALTWKALEAVTNRLDKLEAERLVVLPNDTGECLNSL